MSLITHIVAADEYDPGADEYRHPTLDSQGFIHCSAPDQVVGVAEFNHAEETDLRLLCIDEDAVEADVVWEALGNVEEPYPHIYGPLNVDAVVDVVEFPWTDEGFDLPDRVRDLAAQYR